MPPAAPSSPPPPAPPVTFQRGESCQPPSNSIVTSSLDVPVTGPSNSVLVSLLIYNGWPFADHWEYFVGSPNSPDVGVVVQAAGDVREGFWLEIKRGWDLSLFDGQRQVEKKVPLGWILQELVQPLDEVFRKDAEPVIQQQPKCELERALFKVTAPEKTLRDANEDLVDRRARITQRNCQTWVVESAEQLVREGVLEARVVEYLRGLKQN